MKRWFGIFALLAALAAGSDAALAQKSGGTLKILHRDSPASMSTIEESTVSAETPMMAVFNNLVVFDPTQPQNRLDNVVPDLAESWTWSDDGKTLDLQAAS